MNCLIKKLVATAALFALLGPSTQARPKGFRGRGGGNGIGGRGGGGPPPGGGFFGRDESLFLNMTCDEQESPPNDQAYSCDLPRGDEEGMFVCRTRYHPVTGLKNEFPMCIPPNRAMEGDVCGCCGTDETACPQPCGCTCDLGEGRYVVFDDAEAEPVCVPTGLSMRLVARSTEDRAVTCLETCPP
jgi:hypothetical protein